MQATCTLNPPHACMLLCVCDLSTVQDGAQFGLSFPGAARPSTPATFSISNFELEPLPASHPKPKKPVKKGPLINQEISLTDDVIKTNIQHGRDLIVDRRPLLNFDFPLAADLFSKPTFGTYTAVIADRCTPLNSCYG